MSCIIIPDRLLGKIVAELIDGGVSVYLINKKEVRLGGMKCSGYFGDAGIKLKVALKAEPIGIWGEVLVHEFCHYTQFRDGLFADINTDLFDEWLAGKKMWKKKVMVEVKALQLCELDCEMRVVSFLKKHKVKFDEKNYIRAANAYVMLYNVCLKLRKWIVNGPRKSPEILEFVPDEWIEDVSYCPDNFLKAAKKHCFGEKK